MNIGSWKWSWLNFLRSKLLNLYSTFPVLLSLKKKQKNYCDFPIPWIIAKKLSSRVSYVECSVNGEDACQKEKALKVQS